MSPFALLLTELTAELALFAAAGFLLFAIDDLAGRPHLFHSRRMAVAPPSIRAFPAPSRETLAQRRCGPAGWRCSSRPGTKRR